MINYNLRASLALLILGFILGLCTVRLFSCYRSSTQSKVEASASKGMQELSDINAGYQNKIGRLQIENSQLQQKLQLNEDALLKAKNASTESETKIQNLITTRYEKKCADEVLIDAVAKQSSGPDKQKAKNNYVALFDDGCDSLINEVEAYIKENHRKDSVYEVQLSGLDSVISIKDKIIQSNQNAYNTLYSSFQKAIENQSSLSLENKTLKRDFLKQRIKSKVFTAALFVLSGFTANYVLRH